MKSNALIRQAILAAQANIRQVGGNTKTRGEVRGGGRKPHKQKGTGAARAGTRRSPLWIGGGITFGTRKEQNFKQVLPAKMKLAALRELIEIKKADKHLIFVESLSLKEPKTKLAVKLLETHNLVGKKVLFVTKNIEPELVVACKNIPNVFVIPGEQLNILPVAKAEIIVMENIVAQDRGLIKKTALKAAEVKKPAVKKTVKTEKKS